MNTTINNESTTVLIIHWLFSLVIKHNNIYVWEHKLMSITNLSIQLWISIFDSSTKQRKTGGSLLLLKTGYFRIHKKLFTKQIIKELKKIKEPKHHHNNQMLKIIIFLATWLQVGLLTTVHKDSLSSPPTSFYLVGMIINKIKNSWFKKMKGITAKKLFWKKSIKSLQ